MAKVSPNEYVDKWLRRTKGATEDYRRGVEKVTEAPGQAAARAQEAMLANLTRSITDGTWARRVAQVSLNEWKEKAIQKGAGRIAAGVDAAATKQLAMAQELLAAVDSVAEEVRRMPKGSLEDGINRMTAFARGMAARAPRRQG